MIAVSFISSVASKFHLFLPFSDQPFHTRAAFTLRFRAQGLKNLLEPHYLLAGHVEVLVDRFLQICGAG